MRIRIAFAHLALLAAPLPALAQIDRPHTPLARPVCGDWAPGSQSGRGHGRVQQQMSATMQECGQRIQQGAESAEQLQAELTACEAHYGF